MVLLQVISEVCHLSGVDTSVKGSQPQRVSEGVGSGVGRGTCGPLDRRPSAGPRALGGVYFLRLYDLTSMEYRSSAVGSEALESVYVYVYTVVD